MKRATASKWRLAYYGKRERCCFVPFGAAPSGLPRFARLDPGSLRKPKFRWRSIWSSFARSLTGVRLYAHSRSVGRGYFRSFLTPITHVQPSLPFASTSLSLGRILPRSSVGLASLALGTIGLILRHDCVCAYDKILPSLSLLEITGKALFF